MRVPIFALTFMSASICLAQVAEPEQVNDAIKLIPVLFNFIKNGQYLFAGAVISLILTFVSRVYVLPKLKLGSGVLPILSALIGCLAGVSLAVANGATLGQASLAVMSGPAASLLWDSSVKYFVSKK